MIIDGAVSTTSKMTITTSAAGAVDVHASWSIDAAGALSVTDDDIPQIVTATTVDLIAAVGASTKQFKVKEVTARNSHASVINTVTVNHFDGTTTTPLFSAILNPGEGLEYNENTGWRSFDATGAIKYTLVGNANALITAIEQDVEQRIFESSLGKAVQTAGSFQTVTNTGYAVYLGRTVKAVTVAFVELYVQTVGAGAQTAELGIFSSPSAPNKSGQTLTKIVATGTIGALTATGPVRNTSSFAQVIPAGTHLWVVFRVAMATTQPIVLGLLADFAEGRVLSTATPGALTGLTTMVGAIIANSVLALCPDLRLTID